ncbi:class I SAM-dependent methyltransferase [Candidatus Dojkabacteria bacterium]|nr:class I SAM-dependent methyltransferase [Candidatus Dojkabacteria bacterium]
MSIYKGIIRKVMNLRKNAYEQNLKNIENLLIRSKTAKFLDLGCYDGELTERLAKRIGTSYVYGVDIESGKLAEAKKRGVQVKRGDLNKSLPYREDSFDVIHANQVIEHIFDTDFFVSEIYRLLKPDGYAVISTENLASWHNIFALILGFTPFSLTNVSIKTSSLGNPLDVHHEDEEFTVNRSMQHQRVFTTLGLKHLFAVHSFDVEKIFGSGYYPLPNLLSRLDIYHSAFIALKVKKKSNFSFSA